MAEEQTVVPNQTGPVATVASPDGALPPAGFSRDEVLLARLDKLERMIQEKSDEGIGAINPRALEIDRELAQSIIDMDYMQVSNPVKGKRYMWAATGGNGRYVTQAKSQGWKVAQGEDRECIENRWVDSTRVVGDVVLMWTTEDNWQRLQRIDRLVRERQANGATTALEELAEQVKERGIIIQTAPNDQMLRNMATRALAREAATRQFGGMVRAGRVPGMMIN